MRVTVILGKVEKPSVPPVYIGANTDNDDNTKKKITAEEITAGSKPFDFTEVKTQEYTISAEKMRKHWIAYPEGYYTNLVAYKWEAGTNNWELATDKYSGTDDGDNKSINVTSPVSFEINSVNYIVYFLRIAGGTSGEDKRKFTLTYTPKN